MGVTCFSNGSRLRAQGSGKSTYARALADREGLAHLDLDSVVWEPKQIAVLRSPEAIHQSLEQFLAEHERWVIEGCYGELVEATASNRMRCWPR